MNTEIWIFQSFLVVEVMGLIFDLSRLNDLYPDYIFLVHVNCLYITRERYMIPDTGVEFLWIFAKECYVSLSTIIPSYVFRFVVWKNSVRISRPFRRDSSTKNSVYNFLLVFRGSTTFYVSFLWFIRLLLHVSVFSFTSNLFIRWKNGQTLFTLGDGPLSVIRELFVNRLPKYHSFLRELVSGGSVTRSNWLW